MRLLALCYLILHSLVASGQSQRFTYDFETKGTLPAFVTFQTEYEIFENPDQSGINKSLLVGRVNKILGESLSWAGVSTKTPFKVDLSNGGYIRLKVYSSKVGGTVQVKFEDESYNLVVYSLAKISKMNQWEELVFKFPPRTEGSFGKLVVIFDLFAIDDKIYYFDDIRWVGGNAP